MTPAIRVAKAAGIDIGLHHYERDPTNRHYGLEAAEALGVSADSVYKTLVFEIVKSHRSQYALAVIPVSKSLSLKAAAAALGHKNAVMAAPENAERITGYTRGGISPLGTRRRLETVLDSPSSEITRIYCSGGKRGLDISIDLNDLVRLTDATIAPIAK